MAKNYSERGAGGWRKCCQAETGVGSRSVGLTESEALDRAVKERHETDMRSVVSAVGVNWVSFDGLLEVRGRIMFFFNSLMWIVAGGQ